MPSKSMGCEAKVIDASTHDAGQIATGSHGGGSSYASGGSEASGTDDGWRARGNASEETGGQQRERGSQKCSQTDEGSVEGKGWHWQQDWY